MKFQIINYLSVIILTSCSTAQAASQAVERDYFGPESIVIRGEYRYVDGDVFIWSCGEELCVDVPVRDPVSWPRMGERIGEQVRVRVRRIKACGSQSSEVACLDSANGSALRILEWLS